MRYTDDAKRVLAYMERKAALKFGADHGEPWPSYTSDRGKLEVHLRPTGFHWYLEGQHVARSRAQKLVEARMERTLK